ncbi:MAG TPA: RDD family protein [Steroidobacteraceae bacterium]|nr:RDD family protein [Steroidobacteraceae bacterium]
MTDTPAAASGPELAARGRRLAAVLVDAMLAVPLALVAFSYTGTLEAIMNHQPVSLEQELLLTAFGWASFIALHSYTLVKGGQTIGKYLLGVRIADLDGGVPPLWRIAVLRYLPLHVVSFFGSLGGLVLAVDDLMIFRDDRRCLHDLICGTRVLRV